MTIVARSSGFDYNLPALEWIVPGISAQRSV
jgi:hypothetical protein